MSMYYRWKNETSSYREVDIPYSSIRTSDLKILIAEKSGLSKEFARKIDIQLYPLNQEEPYEDDQFVESFSYITAVRLPWKHLERIHHTARTALTNEEWESSEEKQKYQKNKKKEIPKEFLCCICKKVVKEPMLIKCTSDCGGSACRKCITLYTKEKKCCPLCKGGFTNIIKNKILEKMIEMVNWEEFDVFDDERYDVDEEGNHQNRIDVKSEYDGISNSVSFGGQSATRTSDSTLMLTPPTRYVVQLTMENLVLLRTYEMVLIDNNSTLGHALISVGGDQEICLVPVAAAGGGTSYAIGGFIRLSSLQCVRSDDEVSKRLKEEWQRTTKQGLTLGDETAYRVNWIEKYGTMPMLPARKQPLYSILHQHKQRGYASFVQGNSKVYSQKSKCCVNEVAIEVTMYDELVTCIRRYVAYGSRPAEPFQYTNTKDDKEGRESTKVDRTYSVGDKQENVRQQRDRLNDEVNEVLYASVEGGPPHKGVDGLIDPLNPYAGYCASLGLLDEEQFLRIQSLQLKVKRKCEQRKRVLKQPTELNVKRYKSEVPTKANTKGVSTSSNEESSSDSTGSSKNSDSRDGSDDNDSDDSSDSDTVENGECNENDDGIESSYLNSHITGSMT